MELRYRMAVVTGAGSGLGRELAVALGRRGMAVLVADHDVAAAQETAATVAGSRVAAWALQVDLREESEARLLAGRARDLGGADVLVGDLAGDGGAVLVARFIADLAGRRTPSAPAAVVAVGSVGASSSLDVADGSGDGPVRLMAVRVGSAAGASEVGATVLRLLATGVTGETAAIG